MTDRIRQVAEFVRVFCLALLTAGASVAGLVGQDAAAPGLFAAGFALAALFATLAVMLSVRLAGDHLRGGPERVRARVLRELALKLAFLPLRDPDGPGHTRPRAPGGRVPTAA
ncbi:DUF6412 domain-containing protein [Yinghuangia seranimata]|uniref:DUF6412 domain-containing protein n=1 Tax=Yinghuangia seranimata TaxID=408067 RepID=UPI00248C2B8D|nr:DUF6412 domain-containing protein [Yinghuangia seranimata]MDI2126363.1 DUF6412 domain-containing protein [Yinghuangia seranimata]